MEFVLMGAGYVALCVLVGCIARGKRAIGWVRTFGFWSGFYASFLFTPVLVFFILLCVPDRKEPAGKKR